MHDAAEAEKEMLDAVPAFVSLGTMLKASPSEEGGGRFVFFEASNEDLDHQGEVVLQKALADSSDYYLRHGNVDLSHFSILGAKAGIPNGLEYEIGRPVAVRCDGRRTFVKAQLYEGDSAMARNAAVVWDSLTKQNPPARWYASVGGNVLAKSMRTDPATGTRCAVIERVRWNNVALDRCPVNATVPEISTAPVGTFAKAFGGFVLKTLEAGYGTDSAALSGGAALRTQSLAGQPAVHSYWDFRDRVSDDIRKRRCGQTAAAITDHAAGHYGLPRSEAADMAGRFLADLRAALSKRKNP